MPLADRRKCVWLVSSPSNSTATDSDCLISSSNRFAELPRKHQLMPLIAPTISDATRKGTISQFFSTTNCACCDNQCHQKVCAECRKDRLKTVLALSEEVFSLERKAAEIETICSSCCRRSHDTECISLDCPVLYARNKAKRELKQCSYFREILEEF